MPGSRRGLALPSASGPPSLRARLSTWCLKIPVLGHTQAQEDGTSGGWAQASNFRGKSCPSDSRCHQGGHALRGWGPGAGSKEGEGGLCFRLGPFAPEANTDKPEVRTFHFLSVLHIVCLHSAPINMHLRSAHVAVFWTPQLPCEGCHFRGRSLLCFRPSAGSTVPCGSVRIPFCRRGNTPRVKPFAPGGHGAEAGSRPSGQGLQSR